MIAIYDAWLMQIEITNACIYSCAHCTRGIRHISKPYFANLNFVEKALQSLEGWEKGVGCMGGEPTIHPEFTKICKLYRKYFPKEQCGLWTSGGKSYKKHKKLVDNTFGVICYNDHSKNTSYHRPLMMASEEVIKNEKLRNKLIDKCWLQRDWSPTITPKGAFFCEVASTFDVLFKGPGGYPIEKGWWKKNPREFKDQRKEYCGKCSQAIPLKSLPDNLYCEYISPKNAQELLKAKSPAALQGKIQIIEKNFSKEDIKRMLQNNKRYAGNYSDINEYHWFKAPKKIKIMLEKKWKKNYFPQAINNIKPLADKQIGLMGIFLKDNFPKLYNLIKNEKK